MCPTGSTMCSSEAAGRPNLRSAFEVLDADSDGKISQQDLRAFYREFSGLSDSEEDTINSMITVADFNKDGYVEYEEFEKVLNGRRNGTKGRWGVMEDAFRVMDKDGDGKVGREDLKSYLQWAGFEASDEDVEAMIRLAGGGENDGVSFEGLLKVLGV